MTLRSNLHSTRRGTAKPHIRRIAIYLFISLTCLYILLGGGHIYTPDGVVMFSVSQSLLQGKLDIERLENWKDFGVLGRTDRITGKEKFYAKFGLAQSIMAVPLVALGTKVALLVPKNEQDIFDTSTSPFRVRWDDWSADSWPNPMEIFIGSWLNALVSAAWVSVLFLIGCELKFPARGSLAMALLAGLATPLTHYAQTFFSEPLAGLAFSIYFWMVLLAKRSFWSRQYLFLAGMALGWISLTKIALSILWVPGGMYLMLLMWGTFKKDSLRLPDRLRFIMIKSVPLALGLSVTLFILAWYNIARFGHLFETGYGAEASAWSTPFFEGLSGLLFGAGRGLFFYMPLVLASMVLCRSFAKRYLPEAICVILSLVSLLCLYARWHMWEGGWCWGPRFLVPVIPLLLLPLGAVLAEFPRWSIPRRILFALLTGFSTLISINGLLVNYVDYYSWLSYYYRLNQPAFLKLGINNYYELLRWDWQSSPLLAYWHFPVKDYFMLPYAIMQPGVVLIIYAVVCVGFIGAAVMLTKETVGGGAFTPQGETHQKETNQKNLYL